jgi:hypothetical protein
LRGAEPFITPLLRARRFNATLADGRRPVCRTCPLGEHVDRHARAAKHRIPAHDLAYLPILGRRSGRAD